MMSKKEEDTVTREAEKELDRQREAEAKKAKATAQPCFFKDLTREKSVTKKVGEDYVKITYGLGVDLTAIESQTIEDVEKARGHMKNFIDRWIDEDIGEHVIQREAAKVPNLDVGDIDSFPWKNFQKEPATPNEPGWVMRGFEGAAKLVIAIEKAGKEGLQLGEWIYSFSGDKKQFINRQHPKKEK